MENLFIVTENTLRKNFCVSTWSLVKCYWGNKMGNPERAVPLHLAHVRTVANHRMGFVSSCVLAELAI